MYKTFLVFTVLILVYNSARISGLFQTVAEEDTEISSTENSCFCELKGTINDCACTIDTVDHFNNIKIFPILRSLLVKDFFRFFKVNLKNTCPFWKDNSKCAVRYCRVESCHDEDLPEGLKGDRKSPAYKYLKTAQDETCSEDFNQELSYLNTSISPQAQEDIIRWEVHDEAEEDFCIFDENDLGAEYVDLLLNPERYTGYKGESAHRVWQSIYHENCFCANKHSNVLHNYVSKTDLDGTCLEQRAFYRTISGLHTSINIHLSSKYLISESNNFISSCGIWGPNLEEFKRRFSPETTINQGPQWLKNLYFMYLVELRALAKAAPYLKHETYYTGSVDDDEEVNLAVNELLNIIEKFPSHFDESTMFSSGFASKKLKIEFREKFRNISRIMDCVGCDKCRLWGKLQTQGLGTALKILFTDKFNLLSKNNMLNLNEMKDAGIRLKRTEIVSLFNGFGRLSNSIQELENFRKMLR